jgi:ribose transport system substrate-binding protein
MTAKSVLAEHLSRRLLLQGSAALATAGTLLRGARGAAPKRIGVGQPDRTADFYQGFINAVQDEAKRRGYEILQSFSGSAPEKQLAELNAWIASGVDALVVMPMDANAIGGIVRKCHDKGITFVGYANIVPGADGYMKWNDLDAGTRMGGIIGDFVKQNLGGKAEVGLLTFPNNQATRDRISSTRESLSKAVPGITYWETQAVLAPEALKATQSLLQAHPNIKIMVCCADDGALGARSAYMNSGLNADNVFICGFDGSKQNLNLIKAKDKFIRASAALDITDVGHKVIEIPDNILNHREPTHIDIPYVLVTHETDAAMIDQLLKVYQG